MDRLAQDLEDELSGAFPGCRLTHVLRVTASSGSTVSVDILRALFAGGAQLVTAQIGEAGEQLEHRLVITALSSIRARNLANDLRILPGVGFVTVEHHIGKAAGSGLPT